MMTNRLLVISTMSVVVGGTVSAQRAPLMITDVTVIDGTGNVARPHMTVLIHGGRIIAVDSGARAKRPTEADVIDGRGKFLIPCMWDMHVHLAKAAAPSLALFVANGVTSVRDMDGDAAAVQRMQSEVAMGSRIGPRIQTAGPILESAERVRRMKAQGAVNYYQWLLLSPDAASRIVEDSPGRIDARRRYVSGYLLEDWREQVAERRGVKEALIRRFYLPRAYRGVLRDLQEMHRAGVRILPGSDLALPCSTPASACKTSRLAERLLRSPR